MKILSVTAFALFLVSCAPKGESAKDLAVVAAAQVGCVTAQSEIWNSLQAAAEAGGDFPDESTLRVELMKAGKAKGFTSPTLDQYVNAYVANYNVIVGGIKKSFAPTTPDDWKKALAELEVGIQTTSVHQALQTQLKSSLANLDSADSALNRKCAEPQEAASEPATHALPLSNSYATVWDQLQATTAPEVQGARKVFAIAYQSCNVLHLDPISARTPNVQGIKDLGDRGDGGHTREIASLAQVNATDYYIHNQNLAANGCFEVRNNPPIYNFGAKPVTSTKSPYNLNLFQRSTLGGPTLGIDCSGYVFSALAMAGLKLDPSPKKVLKASQVLAYGSVAFKEPEANGMRCLKKISVSKTTSILPGDIVAINGHVIMIDSTGADPFALGGMTSAAQCTSANIHPEKFDFVIAQSAPIKNGIGINRVHAAAYMPESATIRNGLVAYAVASCRAKFGLSANLNSPNLSIVRHLKTASCLAPKPLTMTHQDCVKSCQAL